MPLSHNKNKENFIFINTEIKENNVPNNMLNLTDDLSKKCNLNLDNTDKNLSSILFNSSIDFKGAANYNCKRIMLR